MSTYVLLQAQSVFLLDNKQEPNLPVLFVFPTDVHNKMNGKIVSQVIERHSFLENGSQLPKSKVSMYMNMY